MVTQPRFHLRATRYRAVLASGYTGLALLGFVRNWRTTIRSIQAQFTYGTLPFLSEKFVANIQTTQGETAESTRTR